MDPIARVRTVASTDPSVLPSLDGFRWTASLTDRQREEMCEEARAALEDVPASEAMNFSPAEALAADWRIAELLMRRPEFAATVSPTWRVSDFWFYGPEWQAGEREADEDLAADRITRHESDEAFLAALRQRSAADAHTR
jgi:hypothetical protein